MPLKPPSSEAYQTTFAKSTYDFTLDIESAIPAHLTVEQRNAMARLLYQFQEVLTPKKPLGHVPLPPIKIELKPGASPYHVHPYPIPKANMDLFKEEVTALIDLGVIKKGFSPWGCPSFGVKKKNGLMQFVTDLHPVNQRVIRKPFPLPKIEDIFLTLEGFTYVTAIDFVMGFYHIRLSEQAQCILATVLPFGKSVAVIAKPIGTLLDNPSYPETVTYFLAWIIVGICTSKYGRCGGPSRLIAAARAESCSLSPTLFSAGGVIAGTSGASAS